MLCGKTYAECYEIHYKLVGEGMARILPSALAGLPWSEGEKILDYGVGTGRTTLQWLAPYAEKHGSKIYGVDNSRSMIEWARANYAHPAVEYFHTTLTAPNFPPPGFPTDGFDKIFSLWVLMLDPKYRTSIARMFELLAPGGHAFLSIVTKTNRFALISHVQGHADWGEFGQTQHLPDWYAGAPVADADHEPHFKELFEATGFRVRSVETLPFKYTFASEADCAEFFLVVNSDPLETKLEQYDEGDGGRDSNSNEALHDVCHAFLMAESVKAAKSAGGGYEIKYEVMNFVLEKPLA